MEVTYFTPGQLALPELPLAPFRPVATVGALGPYLEAYTQPGDLVIDLFCQGPAFIEEAVQAGRRALGLNVNRVLLAAASSGLTPVEGQAVDAAFTKLADARKGTQTLQSHIEALYGTTCGTCGAQVIAEAYIWERDGDGPLAKCYHCSDCDETYEVPTDDADVHTASSFNAQGLSYWLMLDRAAPGEAPHRDRVSAILGIYTPRNLSALNDLLLKSEGLILAPPVRQVLDVLLLETFDQAASLRPPESAAARPRRLQRPSRFVESNVWRLFERALSRWHETSSTPLAHAPNLDALFIAHDAETAGFAPQAMFYLAPLSTGQARRDLPPGCASLIVLDPPRPDTVLWHLSALWSSWLWGPEASAPLISVLKRRWLDKQWLWRGLRGALRSVTPLLKTDGRVVCLFSDENPAILEASALAAAGSDFTLAGWGVRRPGQARFNWRAGTGQARAAAVAEPLSREVSERVADISLDALRARGEPTAWPELHAAIYAGLAETGLLAAVATLPDDVADPLSWLGDIIRSALDGAALRQITPQHQEDTVKTSRAPLWWLDATLESDAGLTLSDRVELAIAEILCNLLAVTEVDLHRRVCARFPGVQTPGAHLIRLCLSSYGDEHAPGYWRLRPEDDPALRADEAETIVADLKALGKRLGFRVEPGDTGVGEWDVRWRDDSGHSPYAFVVRTTAVLGDLLFNEPARSHPAAPIQSKEERVEPNTTPCLTLPGGRAILVGYKLRTDPRLRRRVDQHGWRFLKYRHLRHMVQEVSARQLDRFAFQAALGLDPIVEQEEAQLSLW